MSPSSRGLAKPPQGADREPSGLEPSAPAPDAAPDEPAPGEGAAPAEADPRPPPPRATMRTRFLAVLPWLVFVAGVVWRFLFVLKWHDPRKFVYSDMQMYFELGKRITRPGYKLRALDVTHPPGLTELIAFFYRRDPSLGSLVWFQLLVTALVPLAVALLARLAFGARAWRPALVIASLYFPFVEYGGYFLAEIYLTLTATLTLAAVLGAARLVEIDAPSRLRLVAAAAIAALGGLAFSLAMLMKMVALPALLAFLGVFVLFTRSESALGWRAIVKRRAALAAIVCVAALPLSAWQTERCTQASGTFCPGSSKQGADFLMGHIGRVQGVVWKDPKSKGVVGFGSPAAYQHGYKDKPEFPFAITDNPKNNEAAWKWIKTHPGDSVVLMFEHVWDSFGGSLPWPGNAQKEWATSQTFHYLFLVFLFFPALVRLLDVARARGLVALLRSMELAIFAPIFGVIVSVMMATGEARYRIPWDMCFILLAVELYRSLAKPRAAREAAADAR